MNQVMTDVLSGKTDDIQNADFLSSLAEKGETDDELLGMLDKMQEFSLKVEPKNQGTIIDMCGTGGDKLQTFNISTTASFVVAASGGIVAKHGNRSISSRSGSADFVVTEVQLPQRASFALQCLRQRRHSAIADTVASEVQLPQSLVLLQGLPTLRSGGN